MRTWAAKLALLLALACAAIPSVWAGHSFTDDAGRVVSWDNPFTRIISLYPAHSENLLALGAKEQLIGISPGEVEQSGAAGLPVFSYHDDPERFLAARPDMVLIRPMIERGYPKLVERLRGWGVAVVSLQPHTSEELYNYWHRLGQLTGRDAQAEEMVRAFSEGVARLEARVAAVPLERRPRVFFESIHSRMKTFAPDSLAAFCLTAAGGVNLAADASPARSTNIAEYGKERILALGSHLDVYLAQQGTMNKVRADDIVNETGFAALKAVRQRRVHLVDEELVSRPTQRLLEGIAAIQAILYPELGGTR
jgi:iron complex transport system substrate-binding protein